MTSPNSKTHTSELQQCDRHGVLFNKERYNSCAVCRAAVDSPKLTVGSVLLALMGMGLISFGVVLAGGPTVTALAEAGDRAIAETARSIRLDPTPIRPEIESLETLVYEPGRQADDQGAAIRAAAAELAKSISQLQGAPQPLLDRFGREIEAFGARSDPRQAGDPSSRSLTTSTDWEMVRARVFSEAQWYRYSDSGAVSISTIASPSSPE